MNKVLFIYCVIILIGCNSIADKPKVNHFRSNLYSGEIFLPGSLEWEKYAAKVNAGDIGSFEIAIVKLFNKSEKDLYIFLSPQVDLYSPEFMYCYEEKNTWQDIIDGFGGHFERIDAGQQFFYGILLPADSKRCKKMVFVNRLWERDTLNEAFLLTDTVTIRY